MTVAQKNARSTFTFASRVKKEMTEGIIRALLEDAGYQVLDTGIEKIMREITALTHEQYLDLDCPTPMRLLPDLTVTDAGRTEKHLVEVKYRAKWDRYLIKGLKKQVMAYRQIVLVCVIGIPPGNRSRHPGPNGEASPGDHLRCCSLRFKNDVYEIEARQKGMPVSWLPVETLPKVADEQWAMLMPLHKKFSLLEDNKSNGSLYAAVAALSGILEPRSGPVTE